MSYKTTYQLIYGGALCCLPKKLNASREWITRQNARPSLLQDINIHLLILEYIFYTLQLTKCKRLVRMTYGKAWNCCWKNIRHSQHDLAGCKVVPLCKI
jgi:hypothetical protein